MSHSSQCSFRWSATSCCACVWLSHTWRVCQCLGDYFEHSTGKFHCPLSVASLFHSVSYNREAFICSLSHEVNNLEVFFKGGLCETLAGSWWLVDVGRLHFSLLAERRGALRRRTQRTCIKSHPLNCRGKSHPSPSQRSPQSSCIKHCQQIICRLFEATRERLKV